MRSEEEIRAVVKYLLKTVIDPSENTNVRECKRYAIAIGLLMWVLEEEDVVESFIARYTGGR